MSESIYAGVYKRGIAVGHPADTYGDAIDFSFEEEKFRFNAASVVHIAKWNGYFYEAPIEKLRTIEREAASG
jgi:hypothetical protein